MSIPGLLVFLGTASVATGDLADSHCTTEAIALLQNRASARRPNGRGEESTERVFDNPASTIDADHAVAIELSQNQEYLDTASSLVALDDVEAPFELIQAPLVFGGSRLQILGHINSGTNFVEELMHNNFPNQDYGDPNQKTFDHCHLWKHGPLSFIKAHMPKSLRSCSSLHVEAVAMIRNPLSWISSFKRSPYFLEGCSEGKDWMTRPCRTKHGLFLGSAKNGTLEKLWMNYSSVVDMWNSNARDYERVGEFGFEKALLVRYEDLVLNDKDTIAAIAKMLGISMPSVFRHVQEGSSPNNNAADAQVLAIEKIRTKSYLKDFTEQELHDACIRLDRDLMLRHGYDDCKQLMQ